MNVGFRFFVTICVSQIIWSADGLKLSMSNISTKSTPSKPASSSPTLKNTISPPIHTTSQISCLCKTTPKNNDVGQSDSISTIENALKSPTGVKSIPLSSPTTVSSQNLLSSNSFVEDASSKLGSTVSDILSLQSSLSSSAGNFESVNRNVLSAAQNKNFIYPLSSNSPQSSLGNGLTSAQKSSLNNNVITSSPNVESIVSNNVKNIISNSKNELVPNSLNNILSSTSNTGSDNRVSQTSETLTNSNLLSTGNQGSVLGTISNNAIRSPNKAFLGPALNADGPQPTNAIVNNLISSYNTGQLTNIQNNNINLLQDLGSLQSNILTKTENQLSNTISTQPLVINPFLSFPLNYLNNISPISSLTEENTSNFIPPSSIPASNSNLATSNLLASLNPLKKLNSLIQNNINSNRIATEILSASPLTISSPTSAKTLPTQNQNIGLGQNSLLTINNKNVFNNLPTDIVINENVEVQNAAEIVSTISNIPKLPPTLDVLFNSPNIQNTPYSLSTPTPSLVPSEVTVIDNAPYILPNKLTPNEFLSKYLSNNVPLNNIPQLSSQIPSYFSKTSTQFYPDLSTLNVLPSTNLKSSLQPGVLLANNNIVQSSLLQANNPFTELSAPDIKLGKIDNNIPFNANINYNTLPNHPFSNLNLVSPKIINSNTNILSKNLDTKPISFLPTPNLDLINKIDVVESHRLEPYMNYPEYFANLNSISKQFFPNSPLSGQQNFDIGAINLASQYGWNSQLPLNNLAEVTGPYFNSHSLTPNSVQIYNTGYPIFNTDTSKYANSFINTASADIFSVDSVESLATVAESPLINSYSIPSVSNLPNVFPSDYLSLPQALLLNKISPSNLVVPKLDNLIQTNDLTKSLIDLGNNVANIWIENLLTKKTKPAYPPIFYNPVLPTPNTLPSIAETFVSSISIPPTISTPAPSNNLIVPPPVTSSFKEIIREVEQSNPFLIPSLPRIKPEESSGFFQPTFFQRDISLYSPSVLPTPNINCPVYPPFIPTPPINFPPIPPLFPPIPPLFPPIIEAPILKMGSCGQDSRKFIELLLLVSLLNNNDCDRGALDALIALMFAT